MRRNQYIFHTGIFLSLLFTGNLLSSCQSDARNSTRIPPVVKKSKAQWQNDALLSLSDLISRNVDTDINYFKRAKIYFEKEQYSEALADINEAIDEKDNIGDYFLIRGKINREIGQLDNALEDAQRAEALQQNSPDLYILLADIFQERKQFRDAVKYLNQAMLMAPYDGGAYYVKGMLLAHQGDSLASLASMQTAISLNPRLLRAYVQSGNIYLKLNEFDKALAGNNDAIKRFPDNAELYAFRGDLFDILSKPDTALTFYQKAVSLKPKFADVLFKIVNINLHLRYYYKALLSLQQIQKLDPEHKQLNFLMGFCYEKLGNYPTAREFYTAAFSKDPTDLQSRYGLWRTRQRAANLDASLYPEESEDARYKLLDTSRIKINIIQPRGTTNLSVDSTRKAKIE
jgi:tetratricopeptide (TPR) repeat protein